MHLHIIYNVYVYYMSVYNVHCIMYIGPIHCILCILVIYSVENIFNRVTNLASCLLLSIIINNLMFLGFLGTKSSA